MMTDYQISPEDLETLRAFRRGQGIYELIPQTPFRIIQPNAFYRPLPLREAIPFSIAESFILSLDADIAENEKLARLGAWALRIGGAE